MLDCLRRETSGLRLLSLLVRLHMWLRSSCSLCRLTCSSAFSLLISCSSLKDKGDGVAVEWKKKKESLYLNWTKLSSDLLAQLFSVVTLSCCGTLVCCLLSVPVGADCFRAGSLFLLSPASRWWRSICAGSPSFRRRVLSRPHCFAALLLLR